MYGGRGEDAFCRKKEGIHAKSFDLILNAVAAPHDLDALLADEINNAYERMLKGDVKCRFVIDNTTLSA